MGIVPACIFEHHMCASGACKDQKKVLDPPRQLQTVVDPPVVAVNLTWVLWKSSQCT